MMNFIKIIMAVLFFLFLVLAASVHEVQARILPDSAVKTNDNGLISSTPEEEIMEVRLLITIKKPFLMQQQTVTILPSFPFAATTDVSHLNSEKFEAAAVSGIPPQKWKSPPPSPKVAPPIHDGVQVQYY